MRVTLFILMLFVSVATFAQNGTVAGTITDKDLQNEPLPFASVSLKGTTIGVSTGNDGKYSISAKPGDYVLVLSFVGYESLEVPVTIKANETVTIDRALGSGSVTLQDVKVQSAVSREKETALLLEQKNAVEMKQAIGAQELSRKGVNDAATAVTKTVGVAKQEGVNNVFVRGLGDRYNSTSLNGLPLPSEDPVYKNISLEFFTSNIIKSIDINKTFGANLYGDVGGANINIASKELDQRQYFSISAGSGYNTNAIKSDFIVADGNYNYFGLPKFGKDNPITSLNVYSFDTSFKPQSQDNTIDTDFSVVGGGKFNFANERSLSIFGVVSNNSDFQYKEGLVGQVTSAGDYRQNMQAKRYEYKTTQSALLNTKYKFGQGRSIALSSLYIHDNAQSVGDYSGFTTNVNDNDFADKSFIRRQQMNNNNLLVNQLLADYRFSDRFSLSLKTAYNLIRGSEPDRRTNSYDFDYAGTKGGGYLVGSNSSGLNNRFFSRLDEDDLAGRLEASYTLEPDAELKKVLSFGADARITKRNFEFEQVNYDTDEPLPVDINNPEGFFNQTSLDLGKPLGFDLETQRGAGANALDPFHYEGDRKIVGGYTQVTYPFSDKLVAIFGVRAENFSQTVDWDTNLGSSINNPAIDPSKIEKTYVLPSVSLKYSLGEKQAIRFAASETYTMPQFKETAVFLYEDVNSSEQGNPDLIPSTNINVDIKYDWYLSNKEIVSLGGFYKYIQDPINRVKISSAGNDFSYVNLPWAYAVGLELELRKSLYNVSSDARSTDLSFGFNASYLYTNQAQEDISSDKFTVLFTESRGRLQGASPLLINADLSFTKGNDNYGLTSTAVFNYFHDKVFAIGTADSQNIVEKAIPSLDFINRLDLKKTGIGISLSVKNILDPRFRLTQEATTLAGVTSDKSISDYRKGLFLGLGINWTLK